MTKKLKKMKDAWGEAVEKIDKKVAKAIKKSGQKEMAVDYSAYKIVKKGGDDIPLDNLDEIAVKGKVRLIAYSDDFFGNGNEDFVSPILENPTWLEVAVQANRMIHTIGDYHHVFLEGLEKPLREQIQEKGVTYYRFSMGS